MSPPSPVQESHSMSMLSTLSHGWGWGGKGTPNKSCKWPSFLGRRHGPLGTYSTLRFYIAFHRHCSHSRPCPRILVALFRVDSDKNNVTRAYQRPKLARVYGIKLQPSTSMRGAVVGLSSQPENNSQREVQLAYFSYIFNHSYRLGVLFRFQYKEQRSEQHFFS